MNSIVSAKRRTIYLATEGILITTEIQFLIADIRIFFTEASRIERKKLKQRWNITINR